MVFRRFIILMIALVFVNISLICHEINTQTEDQFNVLAKIRHLMEGIILYNIFFIISHSLIFVETELRISAAIIINYSYGVVFSLFNFLLIDYVFPDWIRKYRIEMHCIELIVFQISVILQTILLNWMQQFFNI